MAAKTISLSLPDDLHDRAKELGIGNWSALLQAALRRAVMIEELKQSGDDLQAGLARLRASRDDNEEALEAEGVGIGKRWALNDADAAQVGRVAEANWGDFGGEPDAYGWGRPLYLVIEDTDEPDRNEIEGLMEEIFGEHRQYPPAALVRGFVQGVAEIFEML